MQIRQRGISALISALGPADAVRFIQSFDLGCGDYTAERKEILGDPAIDDLVAEIERAGKGEDS